MTRVCAISDCDAPVKAHGWCGNHYNRWRRHGDPTAGGSNRARGADRAPRGEAPRFFEEALLLETDDCIIWPYGKERNGYGMFNHEGRVTTVHRAALIVSSGMERPGMDAAHRCHVRACFNPRHLSWKTRSDNLFEKAGIGTADRGGGPRKFSEEAVREVFSMRHAGATISQIARYFDANWSTVQQILKRKTWAWVAIPDEHLYLVIQSPVTGR
jgi:hypothetical protein